ncbi:DHH family phosphoesterase [Mycoplasmatota bacterium WC44]
MSKKSYIRIIFLSILLIVNITAVYIEATNYLIYYIGAVIAIFVLFYVYEDTISKKENQRIAWLEEKLSQMNQVTYLAKRAGEISLNEFPFGVLLFDEFFEVKWSNNFVRKLFRSSYIGKTLNSISEDIVNNIKESNKSFTLEIEEKVLYFEFNQEFNVLYFFDVTVESELRQNYLNRRLAMGYLTLDNLDETLANLDVQDRTTIQGLYFSKVGEWADENDVYIKALSSEKFQLLMDYKQLDLLRRENFTILDEIRKISKNNYHKITASLGIVCWDENFVDLGDRVNESLDMAFDRGGDQVVVNVQGEPVEYFGGVSETVEKRSRVKARMISGKLLDSIKDSENVIVMSHIQPDHDAFGSMIGIMKLAEYADKDVRIVIDSDDLDVSVSKLLDTLLLEEDLSEVFISKDQARTLINENTIMVIVDVNNPAIVYANELLEYDCKKVVIDHHRRGKEMIEDSEIIYIEPYASSSVELLVELMQFYETELNITSLEATLMYLGIIVDTNNFSYRTGARTFDAASFLRLYGADLTKVKMYLREEYEDYMTQSRLLSETEVYLGRFSLIRTNKELSRVALAKLSDKLLMIDNVDAAFVIGKLSDDLTGITARSFGNVNVQILMEEFGGGGHLNNAAAQIEVSIDECYDKLKVKLKDLEKED